MEYFSGLLCLSVIFMACIENDIFRIAWRTKQLDDIVTVFKEKLNDENVSIDHMVQIMAAFDLIAS